jgi:hypothetical protein
MKKLGAFLLRFALIFWLLVWPWSGLRMAISAGFRAQAAFLAGLMHTHCPVRVEPFSQPHFPGLDTLVVMAGGPALPGLVQIPLDSVSQGWIPLAMLLALFLATPGPWARRGRVLLAGALIIQCVMAAAVWVHLAYGLIDGRSPAWFGLLLLFANRLLVENLWFGFVLPFLFWAGWLALGIEGDAGAPLDRRLSPPEIQGLWHRFGSGARDPVKIMQPSRTIIKE